MDSKKLILCLCMFVATASMASATSFENFCMPNDSIHTSIDFGIRYVDPTIPKDGPKSPVMPPSVSIDGHTLYLYSGCAGATLQVVNDLDEVVYTTEIPDFIEEIELPDTLVGEYELQILRGNFCFYATIDL